MPVVGADVGIGPYDGQERVAWAIGPYDGQERVAWAIGPYKQMV